MFIAKSVVLTEVTWDQLSARGLIFGRDIKVRGRTYTVRSLTSKEYDKYIVPKRDVYDWNTFTWCQDVSEFDSSWRVIRGRGSVDCCCSTSACDGYIHLGWRPVIIPHESGDPDITAYELFSECDIKRRYASFFYAFFYFKTSS